MPRKKINDKRRPHTGEHVAYVRVSTDKQGEEGYGIGAQVDAIHEYLNGGDWELIKTFKEVESGTKADDRRPQLQKALDLCKRTGATLVIARIDRLARNFHFISGLLISGVDFICCDDPRANRFNIEDMALQADRTARRISIDTKKGLMNARKRGVELGNPNVTKIGKKGNAAQKQAAQDHAEEIYPIIQNIMRMGPRLRSYRAIARELNVRKDVSTRQSGRMKLVETANGEYDRIMVQKEFSAQQVKNIIARVEGKEK